MSLSHETTTEQIIETVSQDPARDQTCARSAASITLAANTVSPIEDPADDELMTYEALVLPVESPIDARVVEPAPISADSLPEQEISLEVMGMEINALCAIPEYSDRYVCRVHRGEETRSEPTFTLADVIGIAPDMTSLSIEPDCDNVNCLPAELVNACRSIESSGCAAYRARMDDLNRGRFEDILALQSDFLSFYETVFDEVSFDYTAELRATHERSFRDYTGVCADGFDRFMFDDMSPLLVIKPCASSITNRTNFSESELENLRRHFQVLIQSNFFGLGRDGYALSAL